MVSVLRVAYTAPVPLLPIDTREAFIERTGALTTARPLHHRLFAAIGRGGHPSIERYMVAIGDSPAFAVRTPPRFLVLSEGETDVVRALADAIHGQVSSLPGVMGPEQQAHAFAERWAELTKQSFSERVALGLYQLDAVSWPDGKAVPGGFARRVAQEDEALLVEWFAAFQREALPHDPPNAPAWVASVLASGSGYLFCTADGQPAAVCAYTCSDGVGFLAPVYTPPQHRGYGYARALVADVNRKLLSGEAAPNIVLGGLFADLSNPVSNAIYQDVGYRQVGIFKELAFDSDAR